MLLTDGLPNTRPEGGEVEALRKMKRLEKDVSDITVHTFGFGYSLDDEVLDGLASEAGGSKDEETCGKYAACMYALLTDVEGILLAMVV